MKIGVIIGLSVLLTFATLGLARAQALVFDRCDVDRSNLFNRILGYRCILLVHILLAGVLYSGVIVQTDVSVLLPAFAEEIVGTMAISATLLAATVLGGIYARSVGFRDYDVVGDYRCFRAPGSGPALRNWVALVAIVSIGAVLVQSYRLELIHPVAPWIGAGLVLLHGVYLIAVLPVQPAWGFSWEQTRHPTNEERQRISECLDQFGRDADRIVIFDAPNEVPSLFAAGSVFGRYTYVHESLLRDATDRDLAIALSLSEELADRQYPAMQLAGGILAKAGLVFIAVDSFLAGDYVVSLFPILPVFLLSAALVVLSHHTVRRAESVVMRDSGTEALVTTYQRIGTRLTLKPRNHTPLLKPFRRFHPDPPIAWRLERLAEGSSAE